MTYPSKNSNTNIFVKSIWKYLLNKKRNNGVTLSGGRHTNLCFSKTKRSTDTYQSNETQRPETQQFSKIVACSARLRYDVSSEIYENYFYSNGRRHTKTIKIQTSFATKCSALYTTNNNNKTYTYTYNKESTPCECSD